MGGLEHGSQRKKNHTSFFSGTINLRLIMFSVISVGWMKTINPPLETREHGIGLFDAMRTSIKLISKQDYLTNHPIHYFKLI
jgi:hypothetical protein